LSGGPIYSRGGPIYDKGGQIWAWRKVGVEVEALMQRQMVGDDDHVSGEERKRS
jgi:hypothetical protein